MREPRARLKIVATQQEFLLNDDLVSIGRAKDNDIVLDAPNVSRHHAHLAWNPNGYEITDLGSSFGTHVSDKPLLSHVPRSLIDGDLIRIGGFELGFLTNIKPAQPSVLEEATVPPSIAVATLAAQLLPSISTIVSGTPILPVLQVTTAQWTQNFPLEQDNLTLGRDPANDIVIDIQVVSGKHARLRRCGEAYEIVDLGSRNGLTFKGQRVNQKRLSDGDVLYIGSNITLTYQTIASNPGSPIPQHLEMRNRNTLKLGRDPENDSVIDHPSVSRFHAQIERRDGSLFITDLNSTNGTFVNGKQIAGARHLRPGDTIYIGPCRLVFNFDETIVRHNQEGNLRLDAVNLKKVVGKGTTLLDNISLSILPKEFVVIAGVSGGGKSTLLDALNGFRPATSGTVLVNGTDLYQNFNAYRTELGYVPQKDIVHTELTVSQALSYAAQIRMPADTTLAERNTRIQEVLEDLGLSHRQDMPIKALSGGQLKRVSIGVELLTKPSLFFLDEATSGLDPGTEVEIMRLLRKLADQGRTVLLITHATENIMLCDLVVFLAAGGRVAYFGPPEEAPQYFGVKKFNEIYHEVERERSPQKWQKHYKKSPQYQKYVVERQDSIEDSQVNTRRPHLKQQSPGSQVKHVSAWRQFLILSQRNLAILFRDRASLTLMLAIAPVLGLLDFFIWPRQIFDIKVGDAQQSLMMLFVAALVAIMVGSLTSMREIVKEMEIYRRERMVSLKIAPYILSKVWIGVLVSLYQAAVFVLFKELAVQIPGGLEAAIRLYVTLFLATLSGMVLGLLASAVSPNQNVAPLLIILILIPQITFGGGLLPINTFGLPGKIISLGTSSKWAFESMVTITGIGQDVADDSCFAKLSQQKRNNLTEAEKINRCSCLGPKVFKQCEFPGIMAKYTAAVDEREPEPPKHPGSRPPQPKPTSECPAFRRCYRHKLDQWEKDLKVYEDKVNKYEQTLKGDWKAKYSVWRQKRESAIGEAEGVIRKFYTDYGAMFKVDVVKNWGMLGLTVGVVFCLLLPVQKRKDIV